MRKPKKSKTQKKEKWVEFENGYFVSNLGNVKCGDRLLKQRPSPSYLAVSVKINDKYVPKYVAVLVAENFCKKDKRIKDKLTVNHIDQNIYNNNAGNLEWVTMKEQCSKERKSNRTNKKIPVFCVETGVTYESVKACARAFDYKSDTTLRAKVKGQNNFKIRGKTLVRADIPPF